MKKLFFILFILFAGCSVQHPEGSDTWVMDEIGKKHPDWSYDKIEDSRFLSDSVFTAKYGEK